MSDHAVEMSPAEARAGLSRATVGRVAMCTPAGPRIVPVNFGLLDEAIVIRTSPYSELAHHAVGAELAFEVDELDYQREQGWSVVAYGRGAALADDDLVRVRRAADPQPWAAGERLYYLKIAWTELTGRRIGARP